MAKYSIKLGEIHLRSNKPITDEDKKRAIRELDAVDNVMVTISDDLEITSTVDRH